MARSKIRDEFYRIRRDLAAQFLRKRGAADPARAVEKWLSDHSAKVERFKSMIGEMKLRGDIDFATLSVAAQELRDLISS